VSVYRTDRHASVNLVYHSQLAWTPKRTEHNLIVSSGKSKAEVTNKRLRSRYCTAKANYRQEASRGLSATAELLG